MTSIHLLRFTGDLSTTRQAERRQGIAVPGYGFCETVIMLVKLVLNLIMALVRLD